MREFVLILHNVMRWFVLLLAVLALVRAYWGWFGNRPWTNLDRKAGSYLAIALDIQLLLGLILYWPFAVRLFGDFGNTMSDTAGRFFALEHFLLMFLAVVFVHLGSVFSRKADSDVKKHRTAAIYFSLAVLLVLAGIPWPGMEYGRPLLRLF
jgi:hypothetical protein